MKKILRVLWALLLFLSLSPKELVFGVDVIKIGYVENVAMVKTPFVYGFEGYGSEYLHKVLEYTNKEYELQFIPCNYEEGLYLLRMGSLDFFAPSGFFEQEEETFVFSEENFATEICYLTPTQKNTSSTGDTSELEGKIIAVQKDDPVLLDLELFLEEEEVDAKILEVPFSSYSQVLESSKYDYVLVSSMYLTEKLPVSYVISQRETYFITNSSKEWLLTEFEEAMALVKSNEYLLEETLMVKYFQGDFDSQNEITKTEYELMRLKNTYYVGVKDFKSPLAYLNEDKVFSGVFPEIMDEIALELGINLEYVLVEEVSGSSRVDSLDFSLLALDDESRFSLRQSEPLFEIPYTIVRKSDSREDDKKVIGMLSYESLTLEEINLYLSGENLYFANSTKELALAFESGAVDVLFLTESSLSFVEGSLENLDIFIETLPYVYAPTLSFEKSFPLSKIKIINKLLERLDPTETDYLLWKHASPDKDPLAFRELFTNYPIFVNTLFLMGFVIFISLFLREHGKKRELLQQLELDSLTGLPSENVFFQQITPLLQKNKDTNYCLLSVDLDHFQRINDLYGYESGNKVLVEFSRFLQQWESKPLLYTRCHSDIFLLLVDKNAFQKEKTQLLKDENTWVTACQDLLSSPSFFTYSVGAYEITDPSQSFASMVEFAHVARKEGKESGKNTVTFYTEALKKSFTKDKIIISSCERAFEEHGFLLYFQPKVQISGKRWSSIEVLVRWSREEKLVSPHDFIPLFEKNGMQARLDLYVLEQTCQLISSHKEVTFPPFSLNLSEKTMLQDNFITELTDILKKYAVSSNQLQFEVKESFLLSQPSKAKELFTQLNRIGTKVLLDDVESSAVFAYLPQFAVTQLQLSKRCTQKILSQTKGKSLLNHILLLANEYQCTPSVKGVENREQLVSLHQLGYEIAQGFLLAPPVNQEKFLSQLEEKLSSKVSVEEITEIKEESPVKKTETPVEKVVEPKEDTPVSKEDTPVSKENTPFSKENTPFSKEDKEKVAQDSKESGIETEKISPEPEILPKNKSDIPQKVEGIEEVKPSVPDDKASSTDTESPKKSEEEEISSITPENESKFPQFGTLEEFDP